MTRHPINQAVITQILSDLRDGQLRRSDEMGLSEEDIRLISDPELSSMLLNTHVRWAHIKVDTEVLYRLLKRVKNSGHEVSAIDQMLLLGASSKMIGEIFGLSQREIAFRKRVLDIDKKSGRWQELDDEQDHELWHKWKAKTVQHNLDTEDTMDMARVCMLLSQEMMIPMAVIWQAMNKWMVDDVHEANK